MLVQIHFWRTAEILTPEPGSSLPYILHQNREVQNPTFLSQCDFFLVIIFELCYGINSCVREDSEGQEYSCTNSITSVLSSAES